MWYHQRMETKSSDQARLVENLTASLAAIEATLGYANGPEAVEIENRLYAALSDPDAALARVKAEALQEAADRLEGMLGVEGTPKTLWDFRQWLRDRADSIARGCDDHG